MKYRMVALVSVALFSFGCVSIRILRENRWIPYTQNTNLVLPEFFNISTPTLNIIVTRELADAKSFKSQILFFHSWRKDEDGQIEGMFYNLSSPKSKDIFLVLPGMGEDASAKGLAERLASYGYQAVRIKSGFSGLDKKDLEDALKKQNCTAMIEELTSLYNFRMRARVVDLMRLIDFLENQHGKARIHLVGVSIGGIVGNLLMAVDMRVESLMMILSAANVARIVMDSQAPNKIAPIKSYREELFAKCKLSYEGVYKLLEEKLAPANPITYVDRLRGRKILMVSGAIDMFGLLDTAIPYLATRETWEAFGKPEWIILPTGHISSFLAFAKFLPLWFELPDLHYNPLSILDDPSFVDHLLKKHFIPMALQ